jgi:hypothetical protein
MPRLRSKFFRVKQRKNTIKLIIKNVKENRLKTMCFVIIKIIEAIKIVLIENRIIAEFQSNSISNIELMMLSV